MRILHDVYHVLTMSASATHYCGNVYLGLQILALSDVVELTRQRDWAFIQSDKIWLRPLAVKVSRVYCMYYCFRFTYMCFKYYNLF